MDHSVPFDYLFHYASVWAAVKLEKVDTVLDDLVRAFNLIAIRLQQWVVHHNSLNVIRSSLTWVHFPQSFHRSRDDDLQFIIQLLDGLGSKLAV